MTAGIPNHEARSEWARRHGLDPLMVLADLDVTPAPTKTDPNRVRVTFWRLTRDEEGRISEREEDTLYTSDSPPPQWLIPPKQQPRQLRALEALNAAGIEGDDATTSLDTLIRRLVELASRQVQGLTPHARHDYLVGKVGNDAIRTLSVLDTAAEIRAALERAAVDRADLDSAVIGTLKLMRAGRIGPHEAIDTTLEAHRAVRPRNAEEAP